MSLTIDKLKERNQQELPKLDKPYQLAVYAVPQEQWEAMTSLLGSNLPLLTEIAAEIQRNASERNLNEKSRVIQSAPFDIPINEIIATRAQRNRSYANTISRLIPQAEAIRYRGILPRLLF